MIKYIFHIVISLMLFMGCTYNSLDKAPVADCAGSTLDFTFTSTDATCGQADGSLEVFASGGEPPYLYLLDNGASQSSTIFNNLTSGNYLVTVMDNTTCSITKEIIIVNKGGFQATASVTASGCEAANGTITALASGGVEPYIYNINNGPDQTMGLFTNLSGGSFEVIVTDDTGCSFSIIKTVPTGISYNDSVSPIIMNNCAVSGCHDGSNGQINFTIFTNVQHNSTSIKTRTQNKSMPKGNNRTLTQTEIDAIACWVDDGALDN